VRKKAVKIPGLRLLDAGTLRLALSGGSRLDVRCNGQRWGQARIVLCRPLSEPGGLGMLINREGKEVALVQGLGKLDKASAAALRQSLRLNGLTARIQAIRSLGHQYGAVYWKVDTDRGPREFVLKSLTEQVRWLSDQRILLTDVDGNRFEIYDMSQLDKKSHELLDLVL
jgi:hypothetical protein